MEEEIKAPLPEYSINDLVAILDAMKTDDKITLNISRAFSCLIEAILSLSSELQVVSDKAFELPEDF